MRIILLLVSTVILFQTGTDRVVQNRVDLDSLQHAFTEEGFELDAWEVVFLETHTKKEWNKIQRGLMGSHDVTTVNKEMVQHDTYTPINEGVNSLDYMIHAIIPKGNAGDVRLQIILSGDQWTESIQDQYIDLTNYLQMARGLVLDESYTCVKLNNNGIMNVGFSVNKGLEKLNVIHKVEQVDNVEQSVYEKNIYGYSPILTSEIKVDDTAMNFQLTVKNSTDDKKQVIIGTPIILNEY